MGIKGKYFMIVAKATGFALDVKGCGSSPGTEVVVWDKHGGDNQLWYEHPLTGTIRNKQNNLCLDFSGSNRLVVNNYQPGNKNQQWRFNKQRSTIDNDANANKVFDVFGASTDKGAEVCAWDHHGNANQQWKIEAGSAPRYFFIKSAMNGKVVDIESSNSRSGAKVVMFDQKDRRDADNQLWFEDRYGNIRSKLNERLVLDASGGCVRTSEYQDGNRKQFWCIDGNKIANRYNQNEVLDITGENKANLAELCAFGYKGSANQHWTFEYV